MTTNKMTTADLEKRLDSLFEQVEVLLQSHHPLAWELLEKYQDRDQDQEPTIRDDMVRSSMKAFFRED